MDDHLEFHQIILKGTLTRVSRENGLFKTLKSRTIAFGLRETAAAFQRQMWEAVGFHEEHAAACACAAAICE